LSGDSYYDIPRDLFSGVDGKVMKQKAATSQDDLNALWLMREGSIYRWFARFPMVTEVLEEGRKRYLIQDLRFVLRVDGLGWLGDLAMKAAVDHNPHFLERKIFSLSVSLNDGGEITEVVYNGGQSTGDKEGGLGGDYS